MSDRHRSSKKEHEDEPGGRWCPAETLLTVGRKMHVVIFRAKVRAFDPEYVAQAARMRDLALREFGCIEFHAVTEGSDEMALSYWPDEESIRRWKAHPDHMLAQEAGRQRWYDAYSVQVAEITRDYQVTSLPPSTPPSAGEIP